MTKFCKTIAILMAGTALLGGQTQAREQVAATALRADSAPSLDTLFEAAARGDIAPLARALERAPDDDLRALLRTRLAVARGDAAAARDPAVTRLAGAGDPARRRAALAILTFAAFIDNDYAEAARAGRLYAESGIEDAEQAADAERGWRIAALLAGQPRQNVAGPVAGITAARTDRVGLPRIDVAVNGQAQEAVFDTGAALSVLSADTARRLGVRILDTETAVGNGVDSTVAARIGVADRLEIAGTTLTNVAFLIIDDSQLTFSLPGGYDIKAIVGMPVMRALGRFRMEAAGRLAVLPPAPTRALPANMNSNGNQIFVDAIVDGRPFPLLLDTGANQTALTALYVEAVPAAVAGLETRIAGAASAGGTRRQQVARWAGAPVTVAGQSLLLPALMVSLPDEGPKPRFYGTVGSDLLRRFESYTVDLAAMRLELGAPVAAQGEAQAAAQ